MGGSGGDIVNGSSGIPPLKTLNVDQIDALLALMDFHEDWEEVGERLGICMPALYDTLCDIQEQIQNEVA